MSAGMPTRENAPPTPLVHDCVLCCGGFGYLTCFVWRAHPKELKEQALQSDVILPCATISLPFDGQAGILMSVKAAKTESACGQQTQSQQVAWPYVYGTELLPDMCHDQSTPWS